MRQVLIILLLHWLLVFVEAEVMESNKVLEDNPNSEEYERRHRRRRPNNGVGPGTGYTGPCGFGGYGRIFGDKLFGNPGYSYIVAPVNNYYYTCGVQPVPLPVPAPVPVIQPHPTPGFGHHQNHGFGNPGVSVGSGSFAGPGIPVAPFRPNYNYNQQYNRPFNNVVSAAASGFGNALADYLTGGSRPRRIYKQFNKQVTQLFKPLTQLL